MKPEHHSNPALSAHLETFTLEREFILTEGKKLVTGMSYLYTEGNHSAAVRLVKAWQDYDSEDEFVYLSLQELQTDRCFKVSWNLEYKGDYYLWSLADLPSLLNPTK